MTSVHTGPGGGADETISYAYNGDDELTSQTSSLSGTTTNSYDPNGSLTTSSTGGVVTATYTYDVRNKMVGYSSGSTTASYVYDDAGNRVEETVNSTATYYLTDTQNPTGYAQPLEAKSSPTSAPTMTYFLGERVIAQANASGTVTVLLPDGHGSTEQLANSSGTVTAAFRYDAFGTALNFAPSAGGTVFLFGGDALYDAASGTYFHGDGVRQTLGFLFIQRDFGGNNSSNQDPLSLHTYLYAAANPVTKNDPSGHAFGEDDYDEMDAREGNALTDEVKELGGEEQLGLEAEEDVVEREGSSVLDRSYKDEDFGLNYGRGYNSGAPNVDHVLARSIGRLLGISSDKTQILTALMNARKGGIEGALVQDILSYFASGMSRTQVLYVLGDELASLGASGFEIPVGLLL